MPIASTKKRTRVAQTRRPKQATKPVTLPKTISFRFDEERGDLAKAQGLIPLVKGTLIEIYGALAFFARSAEKLFEFDQAEVNYFDATEEVA